MNGEKFPPIDWLWRDYEKNAAWYSGDPKRLPRAAAGMGLHPFWRSDEEIKIHVPIAADLSALSAGMIFADSPVFTCDDERTQERADEIMQKADFYSVCLQAAELASAFGGVFLKWSWDVADGFPRLTAVPADAGLPYWQGGKVVKIKLWNIVREDEHGTVYRLQEEYTPDGHIRSKLMRGDANNIGTEASMDSIEETRGINPDAYCGTDVMLACYVPNILPNRAAPHLRFGRSDYEGLHGLFDALDEAYSAIQRETRLTKTMVVVPMEYLRRRDDIRHSYNSKFNASTKETQWVFSNGKGAFVALDIDTTENSSPITVINPEIRAESRIAQVDDIVRRILSMAGYAPQSAGLDINGSAESGTALNVRERKSLRTSEVKKTFWWHAINEVIRAMLHLDKAVFKSGVNPEVDFSIELPGNSQPDIAQLAEVIEQLERAGAVSTETKVAMLHPDWDEDQREEEIERIKAEHSFVAQAGMNEAINTTDDESVPPEGGEG